jgi:adenylate cyclase
VLFADCWNQNDGPRTGAGDDAWPPRPGDCRSCPSEWHDAHGAMTAFASPEEEWRAFLNGVHPRMHRSSFRFIPSGPRCKQCQAPFGAPGRWVMGRLGFSPWEKNPSICRFCVTKLGRNEGVGAEVELSLLFVDVRGSSHLARAMSASDFRHLLSRFYEMATDVLIENDALLDKFVGDQAIGLFVPGIAGPEHARRAIHAAQDLLQRTGHGRGEDPWIPLGAAVNTGTAYVGTVFRRGEISDFTALGDAVNVTAHLCSQAGVGEILVTDSAASSAGLLLERLQVRHLSLKGHPMTARVLTTE